MIPALLAAAVVLLALAAHAGGTRLAARSATREEVARAIEGAATRHGIPRWFAWAMADKESGLRANARAVTGREESYGLYQVNWRAHGAELERRGISRAALADPAVNAAYWGELARGLAVEARRRGYEGDLAWYAVRLRLKGIAWDDFGGELGRLTVARFRPYARRWQERLGSA